MDVSWGRFGLVFSSIGAVLVGAVLVCVGRFRPSLGPFWRWAVLIGSQSARNDPQHEGNPPEDVFLPRAVGTGDEGDSDSGV